MSRKADKKKADGLYRKLFAVRFLCNPTRDPLFSRNTGLKLVNPLLKIQVCNPILEFTIICALVDHVEFVRLYPL